MEPIAKGKIDLMGRLHNKLVAAIDKSPCTTIEVLYVLDRLRASILMLADKELKTEAKKDKE